MLIYHDKWQVITYLSLSKEDRSNRKQRQDFANDTVQKVRIQHREKDLATCIQLLQATQRKAQDYYKTIKGFYAHQKYKKEMMRVYGQKIDNLPP